MLVDTLAQAARRLACSAPASDFWILAHFRNLGDNFWDIEQDPGKLRQ
jgi:hypothetical protein